MLRSTLAICLAALLASVASAQGKVGNPKVANQAQPEVKQIEVRGILLDDKYRPAPNVPISSIEKPDPDYAAAVGRPLGHSGDDGVFAVVVDVSKRTSTYVLIGGKRFAVQRAYVAYSRDKLDIGVLALARGSMAIGKVRAADGKALPGAVVVGSCCFNKLPYARTDYDRSVVARTSGTVSERGIFRLPGMVRSMAEVRVSCDGYFDAVASPVAIGMPLDFVLQPSPPLRGRVLHKDGQPAAGASVAVGSARTKADADGRFAIAPRDQNVASVRAWAYGDGNYLSGSAKIEAPGDEVEVQVEVSSGSEKTFRVRATNAAGEQVQEFEAFASWNPEDQIGYRPDAGMLGRASKEKGMSGKTTTGTVELGVSAYGRYDVVFVFVRAPHCGWARVRLSRSDVGDDPVVVPLPKPTVLSGRVIDKVTKKPVAGAQIVFSQRISDGRVRSYESGYDELHGVVEGPAAVTTNERGEWRIDDVPPGDGHVVACLDGYCVAPLRPVSVTAGKSLEKIDFAVPTHTTVQGKVEKPWPSWLRIRPHWHRPNMSSSAWPSEFDGSIEVAADGTFTMPDLPPLLYKMEVVLPIPARGGVRLKVDAKTWDGRDPPAEPMKIDAGFVIAQGSVAGEVPWSRLAVVALTSRDNVIRTNFDVKGPVALLAPDRSFRMPVPRLRQRWILFDVVTGIAIAFRDIEVADLDRPITWKGAADELTIRLRGQDTTGVSTCRFTYMATDDHWPMPRSPLGAAFRLRAVPFDVRVGEDLKLWLPDKSGTFQATRGQGKVDVDVAQVRSDTLTFEVGADEIRQR